MAGVVRATIPGLALLNISQTVMTAALCVHVLLLLLGLHHITKDEFLPTSL